MSWFNQRHPRMDEYNRTHGQIPSSLSRAAGEVAGNKIVGVNGHPIGQEPPRRWWDFSDWMVRGGNHPTYVGGSCYINDTETILDGLLEVSLSRGDTIVVPMGKLDLVPEKYRHNTIELEHSVGYALIKG